MARTLNSPGWQAQATFGLLWAISFSSLAIFSHATLAESVAAPGPNERIGHYSDKVLPLLKTYCYDCHADGEKEGKLSLDTFASDEELLASRDVWWKVLKNVRAGVMPPPDAKHPKPDEIRLLTDWIKRDVFLTDPEHPDPGKLTVRRLNRQEYHNTIRDLMGIDFNAEVVFPDEDSGSGFDNVGDALSFSPMLMEKYLRSAQSIVEEAVPAVCKITPRQDFHAHDFRDRDRRGRSDVDIKRPARLSRVVKIADDGEYNVDFAFNLHGSFDFDPARCTVKVSLDDEELHQGEYGWDEHKRYPFHQTRKLTAGEHEFAFDIQPVEGSVKEERQGELGDPTSVHLTLERVTFEGPLNANQWSHPHNYEKFFTREAPPDEPDAKREYAREILGKFLAKAFRGPVDKATVERLARIAENDYSLPGQTFEGGIGRAISAALASPRFLFRIENTEATGPLEKYALVDQFALASRMSYFIWSTMPDEELMRLASEGKLREQFSSQVARMLQDDKAAGFIHNFVGQWLKVRDVRHVSIDPVVVLGFQEEFEKALQMFRKNRGRRGPPRTPEEEEQAQKARARFREFRTVRDKMNDEVRQAMARETEMSFEYVVKEDRSVLELLDANYTFLNEKLADMYGISGVSGHDMRKVTLPPDSARGGLLTQGTMLVVTSNPTRTSPVKRGQFVLENILGTPSPPPPPDVPQLEETADKLKDRHPQLREVLAIHRESPLCASCHARMDPLGLALENFNAMGMWRDTENEQPIDASGVLISGESFRDVRELKKILVNEHRGDFYRCLTQKMLVFALGRGLEDYDEETVDQIADRLEKSGGKFSTLLGSVLESAPFQRIRNPEFGLAQQTTATETSTTSGGSP